MELPAVELEVALVDNLVAVAWPEAAEDMATDWEPGRAPPVETVQRPVPDLAEPQAAKSRE